MSVEMKYASILTFCIPTEGEEADATTHEVKGKTNLLKGLSHRIRSLYLFYRDRSKKVFRLEAAFLNVSSLILERPIMLPDETRSSPEHPAIQ